MEDKDGYRIQKVADLGSMAMKTNIIS